MSLASFFAPRHATLGMSVPDLNMIKSCLALHFWIQRRYVVAPGQTYSYVDVLLNDHDAVQVGIGSIPQSSWPGSTERLGILHKLANVELDALKLGPTGSSE